MLCEQRLCSESFRATSPSMTLLNVVLQLCCGACVIKFGHVGPAQYLIELVKSVFDTQFQFSFDSKDFESKESRG